MNRRTCHHCDFRVQLTKESVFRYHSDVTTWDIMATPIYQPCPGSGCEPEMTENKDSWLDRKKIECI